MQKTITHTFTAYASADDAQPGDIVIHDDSGKSLGHAAASWGPHFGLGTVTARSSVDEGRIILPGYVPVRFDHDGADLPDDQQAEPRIIHFSELGIIRCATVPEESLRRSSAVVNIIPEVTPNVATLTPGTAQANIVAAIRELDRTQLGVARAVDEEAFSLRELVEPLTVRITSDHKESIGAVLDALAEWNTATEGFRAAVQLAALEK